MNKNTWQPISPNMWFFSQLPIFGLEILTYHLFRQHEHQRDRFIGFTLFVTALFLMYACLHLKSYRHMLS